MITISHVYIIMIILAGIVSFFRWLTPRITTRTHSMAAINTYFTRGKVGNHRQMNLANTVLVKRDDLWYLGYVQDIDGDNVFIDFDCVQFPPSWIHLQHVWQHNLLIDDQWRDEYAFENLSVQVALRSDLDGPYVFRRGELLHYCYDGNLFLCYVFVDSLGKDSDENNQYQVVHHWQIVRELPAVDQPAIGRLDNIPLVKHVVRSEKVNCIKILDEHHIMKLCHFVFRNGGTSERNQDRLFVRISDGTITFLFLEIFGWPELFPNGNWTANILQRLHDATLDMLPQHDSKSQIQEVVLTVHLTESEELMPLSYLPWEILSEVVFQLDWHSQTNARRVCLSWNEVLSSPSRYKFVAIDFNKTATKPPSRADTEGYRIGYLVDRIINENTRALVLMNIGHRNCATGRYSSAAAVLALIRHLLEIKDFFLIAISLKKCRVSVELVPDLDDPETTRCMHLPILLPLCRRLFISEFVHETPVSSLLCWPFMPGPLTAAPAASWCITVPLMTFSSSDNDCAQEDIVRRFVMVLERLCPPVDDCIRDLFRELHQYWIHSVSIPYPDGWRGFRDTLKRYNAGLTVATDVFWENLDLRNFDELPLNNLIWQLLARNYFP